MKDDPNIVDLAFAIERFAGEIQRVAAQRGYPFTEVTGDRARLCLTLSTRQKTRLEITFRLPVDAAMVLDWVAHLPAPIEQDEAWMQPPRSIPLAQLRAIQRQVHGDDE